MTSDPGEWWKRAVVYQIYPRSFADSNGDGVGDLRGIIDHIGHIADLGVDAVWLSPIFLSPMKDFGYDVEDQCAVDPTFGTLDDLDELVQALHAHGIRLVLDWVPNHTSDRHEWFIDSRSSRDSEHRDWYVWADRHDDGRPPNNWMATFKGVPAWTYDELTDQSYLHLFLAEQPDLNWANPAVESAMLDTLRFWLDRGVDGFRADVVHLIGKGADVADLAEGHAALPLVHIDRPFGHELLRRIRSVLDGYEHRPMMVGEVNLFGPGETAGYLGDLESGRPELHLSFDFRALHSSWDADDLMDAINAIQGDFEEPKHPTWVLSNHDRPRHRTRYGSLGRARAAAVLSLTVRGTPFVYAGEELGLEDARISDDARVDPAGRDGCRAPIPWSTEAGHGWPAEPWLPFPPDASGLAASLQRDDDTSTFGLYQRLIALRAATPALHSGAMTSVRAVDGIIYFEREHDGETIGVRINTTSRTVMLTPSASGSPARSSTVLIGTMLDRAGSTFDGRLGPDEAVVVVVTDPASENAARTPTGARSPRATS